MGSDRSSRLSILSLVKKSSYSYTSSVLTEDRMLSDFSWVAVVDSRVMPLLPDLRLLLPFLFPCSCFSYCPCSTLFQTQGPIFAFGFWPYADGYDFFVTTMLGSYASALSVVVARDSCVFSLVPSVGCYLSLVHPLLCFGRIEDDVFGSWSSSCLLLSFSPFVANSLKL